MRRWAWCRDPTAKDDRRPRFNARAQGNKAAIDYDSSGVVKDPGQFNSIVSNEPVQVWRKFSNKTDARLGVVIWRLFNDQPGVSDSGGVEGMQRRIVTFSIKQSVQRKDPNLKEKLCEELPGILQWAWSLSLDEIGKAFDDAGRIANISEASIEAQLDASPAADTAASTAPATHKLSAQMVGSTASGQKCRCRLYLHRIASLVIS